MVGLKILASFILAMLSCIGLYFMFDAVGVAIAFARLFTTVILVSTSCYITSKITIAYCTRKSSQLEYHREFTDDYQRQTYPARQSNMQGADSATMKNFVDMFKYLSAMQNIANQQHAQMLPPQSQQYQQQMYSQNQQPQQPSQSQGWRVI